MRRTPVSGQGPSRRLTRWRAASPQDPAGRTARLTPLTVVQPGGPAKEALGGGGSPAKGPLSVITPSSITRSSRPDQPRSGRPCRAILRAMAAAVTVAALAAGCSLPSAKPSDGEARQMVTSLADDPEVQQAFAAGRGEVIATDPQARRVILEQVIREQRRLLDEPALRADALRANAELTRATSTARETRPLMLENTVDLLEGIPDDPELRRRLVDLIRELMKDPAIRADMMAMMRSMMGGAAGSSGGGGTGQGGSGGGAEGGAGAAGGGPRGSGEAAGSKGLGGGSGMGGEGGTSGQGGSGR